MSPKRLRAKRSRTTKPDWSRAIEQFRHDLKLSQSELGKRLGASTMAVSRWERGIQEAPANFYIQLGNLAGDPLCWYFWGRAGLRMNDVLRVLPAARRRLDEVRLPSLRIVHAGGLKKRAPQKTDFVAVPLLSVFAATPGEEGDRDVDLEQLRPEAMLAAPAEWCPNPSTIVSLRVKGNSMSPLILDGYIISVDISQVTHNDLLGQIVVAWNADKGLLVSRLMRFDHTDALVSDQRGHESISLAAETKWRLVGKVLWWTGRSR
jgi:transcriptional regulator with XRE-family HTH domain